MINFKCKLEENMISESIRFFTLLYVLNCFRKFYMHMYINKFLLSVKKPQIDILTVLTHSKQEFT